MRIRPLPYRQVVRVLASLGFQPIRQKGSHVTFRNASGRRTVVPHHASEEIRVPLLRRIIRDAGVSTEEFFRRL